MYNRYIPQPDGSFRRCHQPDLSLRPRPKPINPPKTQPEPEQKCREPESPCPKPEMIAECPPPRDDPKPNPHPRPNPRPQATGVTDFLRQLLPRDFDTTDLLVVLLLLLMAGDCQEDQNTALLTLVLYLFL